MKPNPLALEDSSWKNLPRDSQKLFSVDKCKKINSYTSAIKNSRGLFLQAPVGMRWNMKIPSWYTKIFGVHRLVLRTKYCRLTSRQKILANLARIYYIYRFNIVPTYEVGSLTTSLRIKASQSDGMSSLLWQAFNTRNWYSPATRLFRRLKVLLRPVSGW